MPGIHTYKHAHTRYNTNLGSIIDYNSYMYRDIGTRIYIMTHMYTHTHTHTHTAWYLQGSDWQQSLHRLPYRQARLHGSSYLGRVLPRDLQDQVWFYNDLEPSRCLWQPGFNLELWLGQRQRVYGRRQGCGHRRHRALWRQRRLR